jgi:hypothetical protein
VRPRTSLVFIIPLLLIGGWAAGNPAQSDDGTLRALLNEVRLLRQAIERQGAAATQGQSSLHDWASATSASLAHDPRLSDSRRPLPARVKS